jgi:hypothetical protein
VRRQKEQKIVAEYERNPPASLAAGRSATREQFVQLLSPLLDGNMWLSSSLGNHTRGLFS